jgi:hypothetical protein
MSHNSVNGSNIFSVKYPFIYDDVFLIAEVDKSSGNQWLVMQKVEPRTLRVLLEDRIQCIHTAITTIDPEEYEAKVNTENFEESMLKIRSSEGLREIQLDPEEKFFAFRSWVAGIAEAGVNAITIQSNIEQFGQLFYPIANRIFNFLLKAKAAFIQDFLVRMEKDFFYEGEYYQPSINANLIKLLDIIVLEENVAWNRWRDVVEINYEWDEEHEVYLVKNFNDIMEVIIELKPSAKIFLEEDRYNFILTKPEAQKLPDWQQVTNDSVYYAHRFHFLYKDEETDLIALDLSCNKLPRLSDVIGLEKIPHLQQLHLENNWLEKIDSLELLPNLRHLYLNYNYIPIIEGLDHLKELEVLHFSDNQIETISGLKQLRNLRELYLYNNKIKKIEGLENLTELRVFVMSYNQIEHISGLENLKKLRKLNLGLNKISKVEGLDSLVNLEILELFNNQISEMPDLSYLPKLKEINLNDNPINKK